MNQLSVKLVPENGLNLEYRFPIKIGLTISFPILPIFYHKTFIDFVSKNVFQSDLTDFRLTITDVAVGVVMVVVPVVVPVAVPMVVPVVVLVEVVDLVVVAGWYCVKGCVNEVVVVMFDVLVDCLTFLAYLRCIYCDECRVKEARFDPSNESYILVLVLKRLLCQLPKP